MLRAERKATVGFTPKFRRATPTVPQERAKIPAARGVTRPLTKGLVRVRDIFASWAGSMSIFRAFAQAEERAVPVVRLRRVRGERAMEVERGVIATGKRE